MEYERCFLTYLVLFDVVVKWSLGLKKLRFREKCEFGAE